MRRWLLVLLVLLTIAPAVAEDALSVWQDNIFYYGLGKKPPGIHLYTNLHRITITVQRMSNAAINDGSLDADHVPAQWLSKPLLQQEYVPKSHNPEDVLIPIHDHGVYRITLTGGKTTQHLIIAITSLGMVVKHTDNEVAAFVYNRDRGGPAAGFPVHVYSNGRLVSQGSTDAQGLFRAHLAQRLEQRLTVQAGDFSNPALFSDGIYERQQQPEKVYLQTDRPLYRPGHTVQLKATLVRAGELAAHQPVRVEVRDPENRLIKTVSQTSGDSGSIAFDVVLAGDAPSGGYNVVTLWGEDRHYDTFTVSEYRKPTFEVTVQAASSHLVAGDPLDADVIANYFQGQPMGGAKVHVHVVAATFLPSFHDDRDWWGSDYQYEQEDVLTRDAVLDAKGKLHLHLPTPGGSRAMMYTIAASVEDTDHREYSGSAQVPVYPAAVEVAAQATEYVATAGTPLTVVVLTEDLDGKPVTGPVKLTADMGKVTVAQGQVTTDATGHATWTFTPAKGGCYSIRAEAVDARGRTARWTAAAWAFDQKMEWMGNEGSLTIVTNRRHYKIGDTARVLVNTKLSGGWAWVTIEGDAIYESHLIALHGASLALDVPLLAKYAPTLYVHAAILKGPSYASGSVKIDLPATDHMLTVKVTSNQAEYRPGDEARWKVHITDAKGNPVRTEFSLGVVDDAIYALAPEQVAELSDYFYGTRPNGVATGFSIPAEVTGGSFQKVSGKPQPVRKNFKDTAYWGPLLHTDGNGNADVAMKLPDNLTRWRTTVRAIAPHLLVGTAREKVVVRKPLMVQTVAPRVLREQDRIELGALVHNVTKAPLDVTVTLEAPGLLVDGKAVKTLHVDADQTAPVSWVTEVAQVPTSETVAITVRAQSGALSDAESITVPVLAFGTLQQSDRAALLKGTDGLTETLTIPRQSGARLTVRLAGSVLGCSLGSLDSLATFPYGCTEQTMSGFLPDVMLVATLHKLHRHDADLEKKLPQMVAKGLRRLYDYQHADGGWGWWHDDKTDPWMTAYVLYGLSLARENGIAIEPDVVSRGYKALLQMVKTERDLDAQAFAMRSLTMIKAQPLDALLAQRSKLSAFARGLLAEMLLRQGKRQQAASLLHEAWSIAHVDSTRVWWELQHPSERFGGNSIETTAMVLRATVKLDPNDPHVLPMVQYLLQRRTDDMWDTTRSSAAVLLALVDANQALGGNASYVARVVLNGNEIGRVRVSPEMAEKRFVVPGSGLKPGANQLQVVRDGPGPLLISRRLVAYDAQAPHAETTGITVTRTWEVQGADGKWGAATRVKAGDKVRVTDQISSAHDFQQVLIEDPLPSGFEIDDSEPEYNDVWCEREVHDTHLAVFLDWMWSRYPVTLHYVGHAERPGLLHVMPAKAQVVYRPEIQGQSDATTLLVTR